MSGIGYICKIINRLLKILIGYFRVHPNIVQFPYERFIYVTDFHIFDEDIYNFILRSILFLFLLPPLGALYAPKKKYSLSDGYLILFYESEGEVKALPPRTVSSPFISGKGRFCDASCQQQVGASVQRGG